MSSSPNRASHPAGGKPRRKDVTLDLATARQMLPLVRSIVADVVDTHRRLAKLTTEQDTLETHRRDLTWASRQRRYTLTDEITQADKVMAGAVGELNALGLNLVDAAAGQVAFPARINGRTAAYSWKLGEDGVAFWHYAGEDQRRPIPADWQPATPARGRADL